MRKHKRELTPVEDQIDDKVWARVDSHVKGQARDQARNGIEDPVFAQARDQVLCLVWNQVADQVTKEATGK